jgi:hypothetical protein
MKHHTPAHNEKIRQSCLKSGVGKWNKNRKLTKTHIDKLIKSKTGKKRKPFTKQHIKNLQLSHLRKRFLKEIIDKIK